MKLKQRVISKAQTILDTRQRELERFPGILGTTNAQGSASVPGKPDYVYVRIGSDENISIAFNCRVTPRNGLPVIVGYLPENPLLFQVISVRPVHGDGAEYGAFTPPHHVSHEWGHSAGGDDVTWIRFRQIVDCAVHPTSPASLSVNIRDGFYTIGPAVYKYAGGQVSLSGMLPAATKVKIVTVAMNAAGPYTVQSADLDDLDWAQTPAAADPADWRLAAVVLFSATTGITDWPNDVMIVDLRFADTPSAASGGYVDWENAIIVAKSGGHYTTIQAAINAASAGDCVLVMPGTYSEDVDMKEGVSVVGLDKENTIIDGPGTASTYGVAYSGTVGNTLLRGLTVKNTGASVSLLLGIVSSTSGTNMVENVEVVVTNTGGTGAQSVTVTSTAGSLLCTHVKTSTTGASINNDAIINVSGGFLFLRNCWMPIISSVFGTLTLSGCVYTTLSGTVTHEDATPLMDALTDSSDDLILPGKLGLASEAGATTEGYVWADSTQQALQAYLAAIEQTLVGCIFTQTADATIANTTTETTLSASGVGTLTLPADFLVAGKTLRIVVRGYKSTIASSPGTLTYRVKLGSTTILSAVSLVAASLSSDMFDLDAIITCRTTGASGTVHGQGKVVQEGESSPVWYMVATSAVTVDTTGSLALDVTAQWATADSGNTITATTLSVDVLN